MKICVSGAQCVGKSTFIDDFITNWPMYKKSEKTYRQKAKEDPRIKLNQQGSKESQELIRDSMIDDAQAYTKDDNIVFDRCVIDNLAYTFWLYEKGISDIDDNFLAKQIVLAKQTLKLYDIIFFIPLLEKYPVEIVPDTDGTRDINPVFREEIDNIMKALYGDYYKKIRTYFPNEDCPAVLEIMGTRSERIEIARLYVNKDGKSYGEEDSLIKDELETP